MVFSEGEAQSRLVIHIGIWGAEQLVGPVYVGCLLASLNVRKSLRVVLQGPEGHISIPLSEFHTVSSPITLSTGGSSGQQVWRPFEWNPNPFFIPRPQGIEIHSEDAPSHQENENIFQVKEDAKRGREDTKTLMNRQLERD